MLGHSLAALGYDGRWNRQCSGLLQVLDRIEDVSQLGRLDGTSKDLIRFILVPELDLQDELLKWASLHLRLRILWHAIVIELL